MKRTLVKIINIYQKTLSPDHGWFSGGSQKVCRFYPTCSEYTKEAVEIHGSAKGMALGFKRILRCNPFNNGGFDPVPSKGKNRSNASKLSGKELNG